MIDYIICEYNLDYPTKPAEAKQKDKEKTKASKPSSSAEQSSWGNKTFSNSNTYQNEKRYCQIFKNELHL